MGITITLYLAALLGVTSQPAPASIRVATFNASLNRRAAGDLARSLETPDDPQARNVAEIIQRVRPDILLLNEFDFDEKGLSVAAFQKNYLGVSQNGADAIAYPYSFAAPVNTGVASGFDLDNNGTIGAVPGSRDYGNDALGYGAFPGQYGMLVLSRFPIDASAVRDLGSVRWKDMPGALLPVGPDKKPWYTDEELARLPLSSKSHWDVPIQVGGHVLHALVSHPTPPAFDGAEDRNGRRNHDEIRMWADYLTGGDNAAYLGASLAQDASFVLLGDQNADPADGDSVPGAIQQLLDHPRVQAQPVPSSQGAIEAATAQAGANERHKSPSEHDTADFSDQNVGNLRVDYVLPSRDLTIQKSAVFWPSASDPLARLVWGDPLPSSDHRLVHVDLAWPPSP